MTLCKLLVQVSYKNEKIDRIYLFPTFFFPSAVDCVSCLLMLKEDEGEEKPSKLFPVCFVQTKMG